MYRATALSSSSQSNRMETENFPHRFQFQKMENGLNQGRVSFSDQQSQKRHESSGSRNDKACNRFQRTTFHDDNVRDDEHATSVAAAAFAIHSLEEPRLRNSEKMKKGPKSSRNQAMRRKEDNISRRPSYAGRTSVERAFGQDPRTTESAFPVRSPSGISSPVQKGILTQQRSFKTRPETWEKAKLEKIRKRYEKIKSKIFSCVKKIQAKLRAEKKSALEHKRAMGMQNYSNKVARVNMIPQGARAQLEDNRRKEESKARKDANKTRRTGRVPVKCSCFHS